MRGFNKKVKNSKSNQKNPKPERKIKRAHLEPFLRVNFSFKYFMCIEVKSLK